MSLEFFKLNNRLVFILLLIIFDFFSKMVIKILIHFFLLLNYVGLMLVMFSYSSSNYAVFSVFLKKSKL